jgi:ubiquinone/menaquinone biosynthesis C-methylase UbiE
MTARAGVVRYWNAVSPRYLDLFRDELADKPDDVERLKAFAASLPAGGTVCDLGCGPCAHLTQLLADAGLRVTGIDISDVAIDLARLERPGLDLRVMDASALAFRDRSLDGLTAVYLIHYLPQTEWPVLFTECARVLKPGARLLVVATEGDGEGMIPDPLGGDVETFWSASSPEVLEAALMASGLRVAETFVRDALPGEIPVRRMFVLAERSR